VEKICKQRIKPIAITSKVMATAPIDYVRIEHNIASPKGLGMIIHVGFATFGMQGRTGTVLGTINYWQGGPLIDFDNEYRTANGYVGVWEDFIPPYEPTNYPDFQMFMPYAQLHLAPGITELMCKIFIKDRSLPVEQDLSSSAWTQFTYAR
jgi:hypothetical protein